jgi:predicted acyltransferase
VSDPFAANRVVSIDTLRGFVMFWIIGGDRLARTLLELGDWRYGQVLKQQFEHVKWEGLHFYDLIFPLFLFLVGVAVPYSLEKYRGRPGDAAWRIARRAVLLFLLGMLWDYSIDWSSIYFVAGSLSPTMSRAPRRKVK